MSYVLIHRGLVQLLVGAPAVRSPVFSVVKSNFSLRVRGRLSRVSSCFMSSSIPGIAWVVFTKSSGFGLCSGLSCFLCQRLSDAILPFARSALPFARCRPARFLFRALFFAIRADLPASRSLFSLGSIFSLTLISSFQLFPIVRRFLIWDPFSSSERSVRAKMSRVRFEMALKVLECKVRRLLF